MILTTSQDFCNTIKDFRKTKKQVYAFMRTCFSWDVAEKIDGRWLHCNTKKKVRQKFAEHGTSAWGKLRRFKNLDLDCHMAGAETLGYTSDPSKLTQYVMAMIDIDCHSWGNFESATQFAEYLKNHVPFFSMFHEPSTNGKGRHGYILVEKPVTLIAEKINAAFGYLQNLSRAKLIEFRTLYPDAQVEDVEIKGHCPTVEWSSTPGVIERVIKSGQVAKVPRECVDRADEFMAMSAVTLEEIYVATREMPVRRRKDMSLITLEDTTVTLPQVQVPVPPKKERTRIIGSTTGCAMTEDYTGEINGKNSRASRLANSWYEQEKAGKKKKIVKEDMRVALVICRWIGHHPNENGAVPIAWVRSQWNSLYHNKHTTRAWDAQRWSRIEKWLSAHGWLIWNDEAYIVGYRDADGTWVKGKAAKWQPSQYLMSLLDGEEEKGGEEEASLYEPKTDFPLIPPEIEWQVTFRVENGLLRQRTFAGCLSPPLEMAA